MGKVKVGLFVLSPWRYFDKSFTEMFLEKFPMLQMNFVQTVGFDWLTWQLKY